MVYAFVVVDMDCKNCIYGKEDYERRMYMYDTYVKEHGIPNEVFGTMTRKDMEENALEFMWCEKTGGKVYVFGRCSLAEKKCPDSHNKDKEKDMLILTATDYQKKAMRKKRKADAMHKLRVKRISKAGGYYLPCNKEREYDSENPVYYNKFRSWNKDSLKKVTNSRIRNHVFDFQKGSAYKKVHDRWNYD